MVSARGFISAYSPSHPYVTVSDAFRVRPCSGGALVLAPLPVGAGGEPYLGMDPSAPATWVRPWNPQPGMISYLNFDGAKHQADTPMGGTWRNVQHDRKDVKRRRRGRRRRLCCIIGSRGRLRIRNRSHPASTPPFPARWSCRWPWSPSTPWTPIT